MRAGAQSSEDDQEMRASKVTISDVTFVADISGALFWQEQRLLVVSDLHLEKGSSFARRGVLLPPYDTVATLSRLAAVIARHDPRMVIALGDSFHDSDAHERLSAPDREALVAMQARRDWIWISGNHDPALPSDLGGTVANEVAIGPIDAIVNALGLPIDVLSYEEHSMGSGSQARAVAFVEITTPARATLFGVGLHENIVTASLMAVLSAVNRAIQRGLLDQSMPAAGTGA